jgi:hypothetical protein
MSMASEQPVEPTDGRMLLNAAYVQANGKAVAPAIAEPPEWTWGIVQERLTNLSEASGKSVEKSLLAVCKQAAEERQEAEEALDQGVGQLERALVHNGTSLIHEYHSKVLGRLTKLLNLYCQAQASRLGINIVQPHENGESY